MFVKYVELTPNAETRVVEVARVSSAREDRTTNSPGLLRYLIRNKHWSPFEHAHLTLLIETSRGIAAQLLRHRSFTFQEFSQRYQSVGQLGAFPFEGIQLRAQASSNRQSSEEELALPDLDARIAAHLSAAQALYAQLLEAGVARECARFVLPLCTKTQLYMTGSLRSWIHFFELRDDAHAQAEVRAVARAAKEHFCERLPVISAALDYHADELDALRAWVRGMLAESGPMLWDGGDVRHVRVFLRCTGRLKPGGVAALTSGDWMAWRHHNEDVYGRGGVLERGGSLEDVYGPDGSLERGGTLQDVRRCRVT
jgi:thymidylate synthase (FAD)